MKNKFDPEMFNLTGKKYCFWINETQDPEKFGGYVPSLIVENEKGHYPMLGRGECAAPWLFGKTLAEAKTTCRLLNARRGITENEAMRILCSTMGRK